MATHSVCSLYTGQAQNGSCLTLQWVGLFDCAGIFSASSGHQNGEELGLPKGCHRGSLCRNFGRPRHDRTAPHAYASYGYRVSVSQFALGTFGRHTVPQGQLRLQESQSWSNFPGPHLSLLVFMDSLRATRHFDGAEGQVLGSYSPQHEDGVRLPRAGARSTTSRLPERFSPFRGSIHSQLAAGSFLDF